MDILWINHRDPKHPQAGGAEVRILEIGKRLVDSGHTVKLVCERWPGSKPVESLDGIEVNRFGGRYTLHLRTPLSIHRLGKCDVIIDDIAHSTPWESQFFTKKPVIGQVHHVHQEVLNFELNPFLAKAIALSERTIRLYKSLIAVSESTKNALIDLGACKKAIRVIPNGVDTDFYKPGPKSPTPTVLWVGRVKHYKRVEHVLMAFSHIQKLVPDAQLVIVGGGDYLQNIKKTAKAIGLPNVTFTDVVDEKTKQAYMASSWVTVSSSFVEGWGMTITESAACGTPAVAYDVAGLRDSVRNNETGLLVPDGNTEALAQAILRILQNHQLRSKLSQEALCCTEAFSWDKVAKDFISFLEQTVG